MGEKTNEVAKRKQSILLRDVKTINCAPVTNDKRQQSSLGIDITTVDREYSFLVITAEEKKEFLSSLRKVCNKKTLFSFKFYFY
jgi:phosphorylcholine metabolism protein LicD